MIALRFVRIGMRGEWLHHGQLNPSLLRRSIASSSERFRDEDAVVCMKTEARTETGNDETND